ncbi:ion channel [Pseudoalteromonas sp. Of7M-16]|uniref:ion channel n=1 Tax=Pseudoalteromonas sp. Of7M-16 TaxID=2917756 RepID=UPI001EF442FE|nr:ion channel [Pseudoalteromonas sp. Of7M-16]MCG7551373.1 ion channel [Pseudoalteromonas sp. Of7M-16]
MNSKVYIIFVAIVSIIPSLLILIFARDHYLALAFSITICSAIQVWFYVKNGTISYAVALKSNSIFVMAIMVILQFLYSLAETEFQSVKALAITCILLGNVVFGAQFYTFLKGKVNTANLIKEFFTLLFFGLSNIALFAAFYYHTGLLVDKTPVQDFPTAIYFSIVTWTTLGYGDVLPIEEIRLIAASQAILGYTYMAILIGLILNVIRIESE